MIPLDRVPSLYHIRYYFQMLSVTGVFHILLTIKQFGSPWGWDEFSNPRAALWKRLLWDSKVPTAVGGAYSLRSILSKPASSFQGLQTKLSSVGHVGFLFVFCFFLGNIMIYENYLFEIFQTSQGLAIRIQRISYALHTNSSNANIQHSCFNYNLIIYNYYHYYFLKSFENHLQI